MTKQRMPEGFTEEQIRSIAEHYDNISDEELLEELEAAWATEDCTTMEVPRVLVPAIEELIRLYEAARADAKAS